MFEKAREFRISCSVYPSMILLRCFLSNELNSNLFFWLDSDLLTRNLSSLNSYCEIASTSTLCDLQLFNFAPLWDLLLLCICISIFSIYFSSFISLQLYFRTSKLLMVLLTGLICPGDLNLVKIFTETLRSSIFYE